MQARGVGVSKNKIKYRPSSKPGAVEMRKLKLEDELRRRWNLSPPSVLTSSRVDGCPSLLPPFPQSELKWPGHRTTAADPPSVRRGNVEAVRRMCKNSPPSAYQVASYMKTCKSAILPRPQSSKF